MSMDNSTGFVLERVNYSARPLKLTDAEVLQQVYEQCADYAELVDGHPPSSSAAREEFSAVPEGKTLEDKFMFGLFSPANDLVGLLEGNRHYPEEQTWWIGLIYDCASTATPSVRYWHNPTEAIREQNAQAFCDETTCGTNRNSLTLAFVEGESSKQHRG